MGGLASVRISDVKEMASGTTDYTVFTRLSFVKGLIEGLTFSI